MEKTTRQLGGDCVTITAAAYLSSRSGEELEREFDRNLGEGRRTFVINFGKTEVINSIGVSMIIGIMEKVMKREGKIYFANLSKVNEEIFRMMGLLKYAPLLQADPKVQPAQERHGGAA